RFGTPGVTPTDGAPAAPPPWRCGTGSPLARSRRQQARQQQRRHCRPDCWTWCQAVTTSPWLLQAWRSHTRAGSRRAAQTPPRCRTGISSATPRALIGAARGSTSRAAESPATPRERVGPARVAMRVWPWCRWRSARTKAGAEPRRWDAGGGVRDVEADGESVTLHRGHGAEAGSRLDFLDGPTL